MPLQPILHRCYSSITRSANTCHCCFAPAPVCSVVPGHLSPDGIRVQSRCGQQRFSDHSSACSTALRLINVPHCPPLIQRASHSHDFKIELSCTAFMMPRTVSFQDSLSPFPLARDHTPRVAAAVRPRTTFFSAACVPGLVVRAVARTDVPAGLQAPALPCCTYAGCALWQSLLLLPCR